MLWPGIKKLGKKLHLKRTDSEAVGMVKNCFVRLYDGSLVSKINPPTIRTPSDIQVTY